MNEPVGSRNYRYKEGDPLVRNKYAVLEAITGNDTAEIYHVKKLVDPGRGEIFAAKIITMRENAFVSSEVDSCKKKLETIQRTESEHIIQIDDFDFKESKDEISCCIVEEYLARGSLADKVKQQLGDNVVKNERLPGEALKEVLLQICHGLAAIHDQNIVHGNLKPQNILFSSDDTVKLSDFNVLGVVGRHGIRSLDDEIALSSLWASPEQLKSQTEDIGPWSDIWSLGVIMFQLMRGEHPYAGDTARAVLDNVVVQSDNRKRIDYLPDSLNQLLDRSLQKDPSKRYRSARSLVQKIEATEFFKQCINNHHNEYYALVCSHPGCGASFAYSNTDNVWNVHDGWIKHTEVPKSITVGNERTVSIEIFPRQYPKYNSVGDSEHTCWVHFPSSAGPKKLPICFMPAPHFELSPRQSDITLEFGKQMVPVTLNLRLLESEAIIEKIDALLDGRPVANVYCGGNLPERRFTKGADDTLQVQLNLDTAELEYDEVYDLELRLDIKNRPNPILLDSSLRVVNPPRLSVVPEHDPIVVEAPMGTTNFRGKLQVTNKGGGRLQINNVVSCIRGSQESATDIADIIQFDPIPDSLYVDSGLLNELSYKIFPDNIQGDHIEIMLKISYSFQQDGIWNHAENERRLLIDLIRLPPGYLLSIDFGTTNSFCVGYTYGTDHEVELDLYGLHDKTIPSVIQYYSEYKDIIIGRTANIAFRSGEQNAFRSFKRDIGNNKSYRIYPPGGGIRRLQADTLIQDYLKVLREEAQEKLRFTFDKFVFTHPSKFSLPKLQALRKVLQQADFSNYELLDEATAGALYFISIKKGRYRLLVYDFGGGTIDITYLFVDNDELNSRIDVDVIDVDGMSDFGGDDVTKVVQDIIIAGLRERGKSIPLPYEQDDNADFVHNREARENAQALWLFSEYLKETDLFSQDKLTRETCKLYFVNPTTGKTEKYSEKDIEITQSEVTRAIYTRIADSVQIVQEIFLRDPEDLGQEGVERFILLNGLSSKIPLVKETFEEFKKGKRPVWNEEKGRLDFITNPDASTSLQYDQLIEPDKRKASVALGAALYCLNLMTGGTDINVRGLGERNWSRFGLKGAINKDRKKFVEWIPKNRRFTPPGQRIEPEDEDFAEYAVVERDFTFTFANNGKLFFPIEVYEHFGRDDVFKKNSCARVGKYSFLRPDGCEEKRVKGILRMEITKDAEVKLEANICGVWIAAHEC
jgi:serine/threonine protein kinase/molecular chaperone DnaK (HSP70)